MSPPQPVRVRAARADDQTALAGLDAVAWSSQSGFPSVIQSAGGSFFSPDDPPDNFLVADIDGTAVGYVRLKPPTSLPENAHVIHLSGLAVHPAARRRGAARALLAAAERRARERGAHKLSLRVLGTNQAAIRLYESLGFTTEGILRAEFLIHGSYVDDVVMAKPLSAARPAAPEV